MLGKLWTREELLKLAEDKRREGREVEMIEYVTDMGGEGFFQTKLVVKAMGIYIYIYIANSRGTQNFTRRTLTSSSIHLEYQ